MNFQRRREKRQPPDQRRKSDDDARPHSVKHRPHGDLKQGKGIEEGSSKDARVSASRLRSWMRLGAMTALETDKT